MTGPWPQPVETILLRDHGYWGFLRRLLRASKDADAMILRGTSGFSERYAEAVAATLIKVLRRHRAPLILVSDASWDLTSQAIIERLPRLARPLLPKLGRLGVHAADGPHVVYGVLSTEEQRSFYERWGIETSRVCFIPFYATVPESLGATVSDDGSVFSGGNTNRDYQLLVDAVADLDVAVHIASTWQPSRPLPANVEISFMPQDEYHRMMAAAGVMVVPLVSTSRSVGQQTYLSAMLLGKPVIITDSPGVRDYVESGVNALVVESEPAALRKAIEWTLDPANHDAVEHMGSNGRQLVEGQYLRHHYYRMMWDVAVARAAQLAKQRAAGGMA